MAATPIIPLVGADKPRVETDCKAGKYLTFRVGRQDLAMNIAFVRSVLPVHQMKAAEANNSICGFAAVGGHEFPIVNLRAKLEIAPGSHGKEPFIIVVDTGGGLAGFIADRVTAILDLRARDFRKGVVRWHGRVRRVLEPAHVMTAKERSKRAANSGSGQVSS